MNEQEIKLQLENWRGYSAYEVAVQNGFNGTQSEWLASLVGGTQQILVCGKAVNSDGNIILYAEDILMEEGALHTIKSKIEAMEQTHNSHNHALTDMTGTLTVAKGGTGATTAAAARANLGAAALDDNGKVTASQASSTVYDIKQDTTLALKHAGCMLRVMTNSCVITIPAASSVNFPAGTEIEILRWGANIEVSITSASDVYLAGDGKASKGRTVTIGNNFSVIALKKMSDGYWLAVGDFA